MSKFVYYFGKLGTEGRADMKQILGGKGANLAEMTNLGIPVPPGFTISTDCCAEYYKLGKNYPQGLWDEVEAHLANLEKEVGMKLGGSESPLLVSVRSGAAQSMPGMMDTVLNLGLNDTTVEALARKSGNPKFAWDAYRRFIQMFGDVVLDVAHHDFEHILEETKKKAKVKSDNELNEEQLKDLVKKYKALVKKQTKLDFPSDPKEQLMRSIDAVFSSWNNPRAIKYRQLEDIRGLLGTAVNVQAMVYGNMGETSGTGVAFTRDPSTGERKFYGEYLINAQGEDVVAGIRTPEPIAKLEEQMPVVYKELVEAYETLENHYRDMQDLEFTIQDKVLYLLQTRTGKRTAFAAVRCAVEMVAEGLITEQEAILRVGANQLDQLLHPMFDPNAKKNVITKGLPASPGAAVGRVVFHADVAEEWKAKNEKVILVRIETSPEDIGGMDAAQGILTARGGMTSHAAVVARGMGKCCVAGCGELNIDYAKKQFTVGKTVVNEGDWISLDGTAGEVILGELATVKAELSGDFGTFMSWADKYRRLGVRTNADTPHDADVARNFGAEGIGLCRTEHMFFEGDRIFHVRQMILAENPEDRKKPLIELQKMQTKDFVGIFRSMDGLPVTIRLLDPPLHEFLPTEKKDVAALAKEMGVTQKTLDTKVQSLHEFNPMLGHRGCRLGITHPEIYEMQVHAIIDAAIKVTKEGKKVLPEIMIPLIGHVKELKILTDSTRAICVDKVQKSGLDIPYMIGTMIEIPRAALTADQIAHEAEFFSFGTNDLTQMGCGFSRDDAGAFLGAYVEAGIYEKDPFQVLDQEGIGQLVDIACRKGRHTRPNIKLGICGEHGGEPQSVDFCHRVGLHYVSCSPYRVPIARLAAAQANLREMERREKQRRLEQTECCCQEQYMEAGMLF